MPPAKVPRMTFEAEIRVLLKPSVNDPQGLSILGALHALGFDDVESVRAGKVFQLRLTAPDRAAAKAAIDDMCARLLANPVIEHYAFSLAEATAPVP
ncbi:MAG TPA: phosphoribosylformylglycinamidine synthase subunit PurS [Chloroflexota bacterium]|jgi:phosphoribosylformylglycinamidine synthase|nr:phosphoribosylformylglycinamidine synthase subunit PurS [Chloroflexota bacterium]